jgi:arylsulfatase A-like enzyme
MGEPQREILPIPDRVRPGLTTFDAKDPATSFPPIKPLRPPAGAPNMLLILLDDVGFAAGSAFGGPVDMPTAERLAASGLKYNRFHTCALCAPTRSALLTGRNHHAVNMGVVGEAATSAPGYTSVIPNTAAQVSEVLRLNGYSTAQFGKCHEVPLWETSPIGPMDRWPTGAGFEYFYGFLGAEANQYYPELVEGTTRVEIDKTPEEGYHLSEDLADKAIAWVRQQKSLAPDKPFFIYYATGAAHVPLQVPTEWSDKYRGRFDGGWDALRRETFERQQAMGIIPASCELTGHPEGLPLWEEVPAELKPVLARQMEVYAGYLEHCDHHLGRLVDAIDGLGVLENTLVVYIIGDNGGAPESGVKGSTNIFISYNMAGELETPELMTERLPQLGSPESYVGYAAGWAWATDSPLKWTKQVAGHWGGTRNGTVVHWPAGFQSRGELRSQFSHVIDIVPTILEAAGLPEPVMVNGVAQQPLHGTSMVYSFDDADAAERHDLQYFEMMGNRGVYHQGWIASTVHRSPWDLGAATKPFKDDVWELYSPDDWSQAHDRAAEMPDKVDEMQRLWLIEASKYSVLPLDDRGAERFNADLAGRPQLVTGNTQTLYGGMGGLTETSVLNLKNKSFAVTAEVVVPAGGVSGVIIAQGGSYAGWSLYLIDGVPHYCHNFVSLARYTVRGEGVVPEGVHQVRLEFDYDGGGIGKGGTASLFIDGEKAGQGRVERTVGIIFASDETVDVGKDSGTPVTPDYPAKDNHFTGTVNWVQLDIGDDAADVDHFISPEDRYRVMLGRQ